MVIYRCPSEMSDQSRVDLGMQDVVALETYSEPRKNAKKVRVNAAHNISWS